METYDVITTSRDVGNTNGEQASSSSSSTLKRTLKLKLPSVGSSLVGRGGDQVKVSSTSPDHDKRRTTTALSNGSLHGLKGLGKFIPSSGVKVRKHPTYSKAEREQPISSVADSVRTSVMQTAAMSDVYSIYETIPNNAHRDRGSGSGTRPEVDAVDVLEYEDFVSRDNPESSAEAIVYELDVPPPPRRSTARQPDVAMSSSSNCSTPPDADVVGSSTSPEDDVGGIPNKKPVSAQQWLELIESSLFQSSSGNIKQTTSADREPSSMYPVPSAAPTSRQSSVSLGITRASSSSFNDCVIMNEPRELHQMMMTSPTNAPDVMRYDRPTSLSITSPLAVQRPGLSDELSGSSICTYDGVKLYRKLPAPPISRFRPPCKPPKPPVVQLFWMQDWTREAEAIQQD